MRVAHRRHVRLVHGQDPGLERGDLVQDLGIAGEDPLVLGVSQIALGRRVLQRQPVAL